MAFLTNTLQISETFSTTTTLPALIPSRLGGIRIKSLTMKNFLSVGAVTLALNLDKHGLTLVLGANADTNGGMSRNGAGKTSILQAISFALYGKALSKIKLPNLVNNINNKQMLVTIEFERDGHTYRVERGKKPDVLKFFVDNAQVKEDAEPGEQQGENKHTLQEIERIIGMSHTMFKHIVALNTYTDPFLRMEVAKQREVIEELLGVTQISARADVLGRLIKETKERLRDEQARIKAVVEANIRIDSAIANAHILSQTWTRKHGGIISQLAEDISAMEGIDYEAEIAKFDDLDAWISQEREISFAAEAASREIDILQREIRALETDIARLNKDANPDISGQIKRLEAEKGRKTKSVDDLKQEIITKTHELTKLESDIELSGKLECFCCGQELEGTDHLQTILDKMHKNVIKVKTAMADADKQISEIVSEIEHIDTEVAHIVEGANQKKTDAEAKLKVKNEQVVEKTGLLTDHQGKEEGIRGQLKALGRRPETLFDTRDDVYKAKQTYDALVRELEVEHSKTNMHEAQIDTFRSTLQEVNYDRINELDSLFKHQDFLLRLLTSKDSFIRKKIIDQNLSYLNSRMNYYLEKLGLPHEVKFLSDLSVEIILLGRDFDFEQLSRGEMNRVIMATSWSFRDVWESLNESFNLMFVDEMLDQGTDTQGVEAALGVLKGMARDRGKNVFLISHRDDLTARIDRILLVRKDNGFTSFEEDALS
jgi:DNA repair exonuclease SbcCD ATPase subunit